MKRYSFILAAFALLLSSCGSRGVDAAPEEPRPVPVVAIDTTHQGLVLYYPPTDSIGLRCFSTPDPELDGNVVFCCAAAFTGDYGADADHKRICGDHVSDGTYYQRPMLKRNTGAFVVKDGSWQFLYDAAPKQNSFRSGFQNARAGFTQEMMIHQGEKVKTTRTPDNENLYRALCEIDGKLCVADAASFGPFGDFIQFLLDAGATEAIYMDMGGWNYSWYREYADSAATLIHPTPISAATNFLTFYVK